MEKPNLKKNKSKKINIETNQVPTKKELINFYELEAMKAYMTKYHNPNYNKDDMPLLHPFRIVLVGSSGSMKTNTVCNIIKNMNGTFEHIDIFLADKDEPLYNYLEEKIPDPNDLMIYEGLDELNNSNLNNFFEGQSLCVFDDLCLEKDQDKIEQLYIRGRKMAKNKGVSAIYLSQVYHKIPRAVRLQSNIIILKKINSNRDIKTILGDKDLCGLKPKELLKMYNYCVKDDNKNFLYIDTSTKDVEFRKGFTEILNVDNYRLIKYK